jgi:hypothetical protein
MTVLEQAYINKTVGVPPHMYLVTKAIFTETYVQCIAHNGCSASVSLLKMLSIEFMDFLGFLGTRH